MGLYITQARGIRKASAVITVAAAATPENLFLQTVSGQNPRRFCIRKVMAYLAANCIVTFGTGLGGLFVASLPVFPVIGTFLNTWQEDEIVEVWLNATLTVQSTVLGVAIQVEVEEIE